jgi:hypothetical protein
MKNSVFLDVEPCKSYVNRRFGDRIDRIFKVTLKRRFTQDLHCATSQETEFFLQQLIGLFGRGDRGDEPVARPMPRQVNTNSEETPAYIHASTGIRTQDRSI